MTPKRRAANAKTRPQFATNVGGFVRETLLGHKIISKKMQVSAIAQHSRPA
jgi:hypothetical protein